MKMCPSCGGIIGQECFNPDECALITMQMEADQKREQDQRIQDLEIRCIQMEAQLQEITQKAQ